MSDGPLNEQKLARAVRRLRPAALFRDLDDAGLEHVARLARPLAYLRGAHLNEPVAAAGSIYLIANGRLRFYRHSPIDRQVTLDLMGAGEAFRFLAREPDGGPTTVAEVLTRRTELYRFPGPPLLEALAAHAHVLSRVVTESDRKLAQAHAALTEVVLYDVETRLARLLVRLAAGDMGECGQGRYVAATHEEMAWRINASREDVSRYVRHFAHLGLIATELHRHGIVVHDDLAAYAQQLALRRRGDPAPFVPRPAPSLQPSPQGSSGYNWR